MSNDAQRGTPIEMRKRLNERDDARTEIRFARIEPPLWGILGNELPVRDYDAPTYHAKYRTGTAIVIPDDEAEPTELRIPDINAKEPGDFSRFMDRLVEKLGISRVRFVGVLESEFIEQGKEDFPESFPEWGRSLYEVLDGFEEEFESWDDHPRFDDGETNCLVGEWRADR